MDKGQPFHETFKPKAQPKNEGSYKALISNKFPSSILQVKFVGKKSKAGKVLNESFGQ